MQLGTEFMLNASNVPSQIFLDLPFTLTFNILVSAQRCLQFYRFVALEALLYFSLNMLYFVMASFFGMAGMIVQEGLKLETRISNLNIWKRLLQHLTGLFVFTKSNHLIIGGEGLSAG